MYKRGQHRAPLNQRSRLAVTVSNLFALRNSGRMTVPNCPQPHSARRAMGQMMRGYTLLGKCFNVTTPSLFAELPVPADGGRHLRAVPSTVLRTAFGEV
uniref:Transposase n=1 Tax=Ascaris lumbricoides TaxID=6252 RepID=A0A0M3I771_ASCLU